MKREKIVIVQSGFLGDAILASGMLRAIASARPDAGVGLVVRSGFAELFEGHPGGARLHRFDKKGKEGMVEMVRELRDAGYDTALLPHRSMRSALLAKRAGIGRRVGFRQCEAPWLLTDWVEYEIALHETERNGRLLERIGIDAPAADRAAWLVPSSHDIDAMRSRFDDGRPIILVAPGSVWATKRWTPEGFAGVAGNLRRAGKHVILIGSDEEVELCRDVARSGGIAEDDVACGSLSLRQLLALVAIAERVITNDSAPLHLAESVATPVTAIFGPTVPEFGFGPKGRGSIVVQRNDLPCRPCSIHGARRCPIGTHECMRGVGGSDVRCTIDD